jgi:deazaflavin-dependent oxidoreductase (nitroreductase family)
MPLEGEYEPGTWDIARNQVELFESTNGAEGTVLNGAPCIILTNVGAKTGKLRKNPLIRVTDGTNYAVLGSMGGAPKSPGWVTNLRTNPLVGPVKKDYSPGRWRAMAHQWWAQPPRRGHRTTTTRPRRTGSSPCLLTPVD